MQIAALATATVVAACVFTAAVAQTPNTQPQMQNPQMNTQTPNQPPGYVADSQSHYSPQDVAAARQAYRAACQGHQSNEFCDCLAAGVAQAMPPRLVRQASSGIGDRLAAPGSDPSAPLYRADARHGTDDPSTRIAEVEGHYANACQQLRR